MKSLIMTPECPIWFKDTILKMLVQTLRFLTLFKTAVNLKFMVNEAPNNRDLYEGVFFFFNFWSKFGYSSLTTGDKL